MVVELKPPIPAEAFEPGELYFGVKDRIELLIKNDPHLSQAQNTEEEEE